MYGCGKCVRICATHFPNSCPDVCKEGKDLAPFSCQSGRCKDCSSQGYTPPRFETDAVNDDEMITYTLFTPHTRCNLHGGNFLDEYETAPKIRCSICEGLSKSDRKKRQAKIVRKKFRTKHTVRFKEFISKDGVYSDHLRKMFAHKHRVILLGRDHKKKHRMKHARMRPFIAKLERDFAERLALTADKEQQFQYFSKDTSVGFEGITVYFRPQDKTDYEKHFYSIISTEKEQDGRIVYANTKIVLDRILRDIDRGGILDPSPFPRGCLRYWMIVMGAWNRISVRQHSTCCISWQEKTTSYMTVALMQKVMAKKTLTGTAGGIRLRFCPS